MALPATQLNWEPPVEERVARLEANVQHIQSDVSEIKTDLREMRQEFRQDILRLDDKVGRVDDKIDGVASSLASAKLWALGLYVALAAALLGTMATGFLWLAEKL